MKSVKTIVPMVVYTPSTKRQNARRLWKAAGDKPSAHSVWDDRHLCL